MESKYKTVLMNTIREKPLLVYAIMIIAFLATGYIWRFSDDFTVNIMIELIGTIITIVIIDELLLKSKKKRWNIVKDEIDYVLGRTINVLREDLLIQMFDFKI